MTVTTFSEPRVELLDHMGSDIDIAYAAWVSSVAGDERSKDVGRWERLIAVLKEHHHSSPFEMVEIKLRVETSIMISREWFRHRTQSYNEQSGRYTKYEASFYVPGIDRPLINVGTDMRPNYVPADPELHERFVNQLIEGYEAQWARYEEAISWGISKEMARMHLQPAIKTTFYAKTDLLNWMRFLVKRTSKPGAYVQGHPMWEIEKLADEVEKILTELYPVAMETFNRFGRVVV